MENYFDKQIELRYYEMDNFGAASPVTMLTLLEETAADHCHSIDVSLYDLERDGIGWVLLSGYMQMYRYPRYKENITIRTWLSKYSAVKGYRENIVFDESGLVIGRTKGLWVFFDINRRRPIEIPEKIRSRWSSCAEECLKHNLTERIEAISEARRSEQYQVHRYDTDMYKHVNNIRYLHWIVDSMPEEIVKNYYMHTIDGRFVGEAMQGDVINALTADGGQPDSFTHAVRVDGSDKVCATARTKWCLKPKK